MSASAPRKDPRHRRTNLRPSRVGGRSRARQPIIAVLLGVVGFALLVAYSAIGAGGAVANAVDTVTIHVKQDSLNQTEGCTAGDATGAHFIITGFLDDPQDAPSSITVIFSDDSTASAGLDEVNG